MQRIQKSVADIWFTTECFLDKYFEQGRVTAPPSTIVTSVFIELCNSSRGVCLTGALQKYSSFQLLFIRSGTCLTCSYGMLIFAGPPGPRGPPGPAGPPGPICPACYSNEVRNKTIGEHIHQTNMLMGEKNISTQSLINKPASIKMESTFGAWMSDASRQDEGRYWLADHFSGRLLVELRNISALQDSSNKNIDVRRFFQGCGHVVYKQSFYFHKAGTNRLMNGTNTLIMENSRYHQLTYLFPNSKTYFKFAVDENGLWVIFASNADDDTMVAKINPDTFIVELIINTHYPTTKAGNAFIVCGVLYFTDDKDRRVTYAFDLKKESPLDASFDLRPANGTLAMLSYYPNKKLLYMWDSRSITDN
uniref:Olfactomedin-like domain-containing protein n=1 Tax=Sander lucioperca TaxID=283035 RepID=A0A8C9Y114_SANLU